MKVSGNRWRPEEATNLSANSDERVPRSDLRRMPIILRIAAEQSFGRRRLRPTMLRLCCI
jgi:hypothetical protein